MSGHTASTKSPAAATYAEMTRGVMILLVGSLMLSASASTGSKVTVKIRRRATSSGINFRGYIISSKNLRLAAEAIRGWPNRLDTNNRIRFVVVFLHDFRAGGSKELSKGAEIIARYRRHHMQISLGCTSRLTHAHDNNKRPSLVGLA